MVETVGDLVHALTARQEAFLDLEQRIATERQAIADKIHGLVGQAAIAAGDVPLLDAAYAIVKGFVAGAPLDVKLDDDLARRSLGDIMGAVPAENREIEHLLATSVLAGFGGPPRLPERAGISPGVSGKGLIERYPPVAALFADSDGWENVDGKRYFPLVELTSLLDRKSADANPAKTGATAYQYIISHFREWKQAPPLPDIVAASGRRGWKIESGSLENFLASLAGKLDASPTASLTFRSDPTPAEIAALGVKKK